MAIRQIEDFKIKEIANAIRSKTGKTATLTLDQMSEEIAGIETGGGDGSPVVATSEIDIGATVTITIEDYVE